MSQLDQGLSQAPLNERLTGALPRLSVLYAGNCSLDVACASLSSPPNVCVGQKHHRLLEFDTRAQTTWDYCPTKKTSG